MSRVGVIMSTYNGAAYVLAQLNSILSQTHRDLVVIVVDDCSTDDTLHIVKRLAESDARIFYKKNQANLGVNGSFQEAIRSAPQCDFYCLADQDDIWPDDRIEKFLSAALTPSDYAGDGPVPTLFVCQYQTFERSPDNPGVTSARLLGIDKQNIDWKRTLIGGNSLYGCCFFFNDRLKSLIENIPCGKTTHDYWIALVAAYTGKIIVLPFIGTLYRQHASNASYGAPSQNWIVKLRRIKRSLNEDIRSRAGMSLLFSELLAQHSSVLSAQEKHRLERASASYLKGAMTLLMFQLTQRTWRLNPLGNVLRVMACFVQAVRREHV